VKPEEVIRLAVLGIQTIISLAEGLGQRDAVLAALDATLAAARSQTDRDLERKHGGRS
jgi:hypothetical protein